MTFFGKIYGQWDNSWGDDLDMFYGLGYLGWEWFVGIFKPYIGLHNQSETMSQPNMVKQMAGMVMLLVGQQYYLLRYLTKNLFYLTGMK